MGKSTGIEWTDHTFNPWRGCTKVSPGCAHCYAEMLSRRNHKVLGVWGPEGTRVVASEAMWQEPLKWSAAAIKEGRRRRVFCASLADVFEDREDLVAPRNRLWQLIRESRMLDWQLLTKRPENIPGMLPMGDWFNVWLGTSVECQEHLWRADALQDADQQRVPVRFLSCEPLLGPLDLRPVLGAGGINWVIIGGESGGQARELKTKWVRQIIEDCRLANVACFVKQLGASPSFYGDSVPLQVLTGHDPKWGDMDKWPADLRVREFPHV